jgi:hypothetical protein
MAESNGSGDIIIKGGSVEVQFDSAGYTKNGNQHDNPNKKITQIVVVDENGVEKCNSGDSPSGLKWKVSVTTK